MRIERLWRDVRQGSLEFWRQIFMHLEEIELLDMGVPAHRTCIIIIFLPRIQKSLDEMRTSWNNHKLRTEGNRSPIALYELSKERAITEGYWNSDPGDTQADIHDFYGCDSEDGPIQEEELLDDLSGRHRSSSATDSSTIAHAKEILKGLDIAKDDGNNGIYIYCEAVIKVLAGLSSST